MPLVQNKANNRTHLSQTPEADRFWLVNFVLIVAGAILISRVFYLQVIKSDYYKNLAKNNQVINQVILAKRGSIYANGRSGVLPMAVNEQRYNLIADPSIASKKQADLATKLLSIKSLNLISATLEKQLASGSKYEILAKKLSTDQKAEIDGMGLLGVRFEKLEVRTYPQGLFGAQVLGFVNDDGQGQYGIEQYLNKELGGTPGIVNTATDSNGVTLQSNTDQGIVKKPIDGKNILLTIDSGLQQSVESLLKEGLISANSEQGSAVIIEANTGAIKAIANYPSYDPGSYSTVEDQRLFSNAAVSEPLEVGSIMKPLTAAAALNEGVETTTSSYYDPGFVKIDGATVSNVSEVAGAGNRTVQDILQLSLNTGAVHLLKSLGGGEINDKARQTWHKYLTDKYNFGKLTGIEISNEQPGSIADPDNGYGLGIKYANMSFGQGMTQTPLQIAAAAAAVLNGGTYYKPHLVQGYVDGDKVTNNPPIVVTKDVVSKEVSSNLQKMMEYVVEKNNKPADRAGFVVGGKTGTAQVAIPEGGYDPDRFNGTYLGFVGLNKPDYIIVIKVIAPKIKGYAGAKAAAPIFANISNSLIDQFGLSLR
jgi:cell division protein FtsI (penicillin-binding protein 3)